MSLKSKIFKNSEILKKFLSKKILYLTIIGALIQLLFGTVVAATYYGPYNENLVKQKYTAHSIKEGLNLNTPIRCEFNILGKGDEFTLYIKKNRALLEQKNTIAGKEFQKYHLYVGDRIYRWGPKTRLGDFVTKKAVHNFLRKNPKMMSKKYNIFPLNLIKTSSQNQKCWPFPIGELELPYDYSFRNFGLLMSNLNR